MTYFFLCFMTIDVVRPVAITFPKWQFVLWTENWSTPFLPLVACVKTFYHRKRKRNHFENVDKLFPCKMEILLDWLYWQGKIQKSHVVVLHKQSSFSCHSFGVNYILIFSQILFPGNKRYITHSSFFPLFIPNFYWKVLAKFKFKLGFKPEF